MEIKLIFNSKIPRKLGAHALFIYPFIFFEYSRDFTSEITLKHEFIHLEQVKRYGLVKFVFLSTWQKIKSWWGGKSADLDSEFEREAYSRQFEDFTDYEEYLLDEARGIYTGARKK